MWMILLAYGCGGGVINSQEECPERSALTQIRPTQREETGMPDSGAGADSADSAGSTPGVETYNYTCGESSGNLDVGVVPGATPVRVSAWAQCNDAVNWEAYAGEEIAPWKLVTEFAFDGDGLLIVPCERSYGYTWGDDHTYTEGYVCPTYTISVWQ